MVLKDGKLAYVFGTPGGETIGQTEFQVLVNLLDFGMPVQQAIEAPRLALDAEPNFYKPGAAITVQIEGRVPAATVEALKAMGHTVRVLPGWGSLGPHAGDRRRSAHRRDDRRRRPAAHRLRDGLLRPATLPNQMAVPAPVPPGLPGRRRLERPDQPRPRPIRRPVRRPLPPGPAPAAHAGAALDSLANPAQVENWLGLASIGVALAFAAWFERLAARDLPPTWLGFATSQFDIAVISLGFVSFLVAGRPIVATNSLVHYTMYFVALAGTGLRYDPRVCLAAGAAALRRVRRHRHLGGPVRSRRRGRSNPSTAPSSGTRR